MVVSSQGLCIGLQDYARGTMSEEIWPIDNTGIAYPSDDLHKQQRAGIVAIKVENIQTVLFADDDANIRLIVQMSLEGLTKWKVLLAGTGNEAVQAAKEQKPDLILLDVMMPDMDGTEVFAEIAQSCTDKIPIIFITAKVQRQEISRYKSLGALGLIMKPFNPMKLADEIKAIIGANVTATDSLKVAQETKLT